MNFSTVSEINLALELEYIYTYMYKYIIQIKNDTCAPNMHLVIYNKRIQKKRIIKLFNIFPLLSLHPAWRKLRFIWDGRNDRTHERSWIWCQQKLTVNFWISKSPWLRQIESLWRNFISFYHFTKQQREQLRRGTQENYSTFCSC